MKNMVRPPNDTLVFGCENVDIPEEFYIGITACEGANKFYEFSIEE